MNKQILKIIFGLAFLVLFLKWAKLFDFFSHIKEVNLLIFTLACILSAFTQVVRAARFQYMASALKIKLKFYKVILVQYLATVGGLMTPGKIGEGSKIIFFGKKHIARLGELFVIEKTNDLLVVLLFSALNLTILTEYRRSLILFAVLFIIALIFLINFDRITKLLINKKFDVDFKKAFKTFITNKKLLIGTIIFSFAVWTVIFYNVYLFLTATGIQVSFMQVACFFAISSLVGIISGIPGGLGVREVSFAYLLITFANVGKELAALGTLAYVFGTYGTLFIMFIVSTLLLRKME